MNVRTVYMDKSHLAVASEFYRRAVTVIVSASPQWMFHDHIGRHLSLHCAVADYWKRWVAEDYGVSLIGSLQPRGRRCGLEISAMCSYLDWISVHFRCDQTPTTQATCLLRVLSKPY